MVRTIRRFACVSMVRIYRCDRFSLSQLYHYPADPRSFFGDVALVRMRHAWRGFVRLRVSAWTRRVERDESIVDLDRVHGGEFRVALFDGAHYTPICLCVNG